MKKNTRMITHGAMLAALYAALCYLQNALIPNSANWMIQFRAAEALCVLSLFTPAAIPGLTLGCLAYNLSFAGALPLDFLVGSLATALATAAMWLLRRVKIGGYPLPALAMPALFNALLVGWELNLYIGGGFWINAAYVAIGEVAVLFTLGIVVYYAMSKPRLSRIFAD